MTPIAIEFFGHAIHWYGIMAGIGFLTAMWICQRKRAYAGLTEDQVTNVAVWTMLLGIVGARIYYVATHYDIFENGPFWKIAAVWEGGLVFYGGFILATLFMIFYCWKNKLPITKTMDLFAIALPAGHIFGRIGCFLQGCCFGAPTECVTGFHYPQSGHLNPNGVQIFDYADIITRYPISAIHPVQLYEAFGILLLFIFLYRTLGKFKPGHTTALYFILYAIIRFIAESFRGEYSANQLVNVFGFDLMPGHIDSLCIILPAGIIMWVLCSQLDKRTLKK